VGGEVRDHPLDVLPARFVVEAREQFSGNVDHDAPKIAVRWVCLAALKVDWSATYPVLGFEHRRPPRVLLMAVDVVDAGDDLAERKWSTHRLNRRRFLLLPLRMQWGTEICIPGLWALVVSNH
jgi:hypothetical protein